MDQSGVNLVKGESKWPKWPYRVPGNGTLLETNSGPNNSEMPTRRRWTRFEGVLDPSKGVSKWHPSWDPYLDPLRTTPDGMCGSKGPCQQHIHFVPFGPKYPVPFGTGFGVKFGAIWSPWVPTQGGWNPGIRDLTYIAEPKHIMCGYVRLTHQGAYGHTQGVWGPAQDL